MNSVAKNNTFNVEAIRKDFPILNRSVNGKPLVYFDNGATSQTPQAVIDEVTKNGEFHKNSDIPKLFINADPGSILVGDQREFVRSWKNLQEVTVKGNHFIQEHSPKEIGDALKNFLKSL